MADPGPTPERAATITIPRWIQLVGLPVLALLAWTLASTLGHALFLFLTASVIAFTLNPLVRDLQRLRLPRGLAVGTVYLLFVAVVVVALLLVATVVVDQGRTAADRIDAYVTEEDGRTGLNDRTSHPALVIISRSSADMNSAPTPSTRTCTGIPASQRSASASDTVRAASPSSK